MFLQYNSRYNPFIPMDMKTNFGFIWAALSELDYVWLNPMGFSHPIIYLPKEQVKLALVALEKNQNLILTKSKGLGTVLRVKLNGETCILRFVHHLQTHGLVIVPAKDMLGNTKTNIYGIKVPSEFNLLEYHFLRDYLHGHGLKRTTFLYFNDMHPFTKTDLLEALNEKYNTSFTRFAQMTQFDKQLHGSTIKALEKMPWNRYFRKLGNNLRPLYFRLARQAGIF